MREKGRFHRQYHGERIRKIPLKSMRYTIRGISFSVISGFQINRFRELFAHVGQNETIDIGLFFNLFAQRFASAVARFRVDADEHGRLSALAFLHSCRELEAMCRHNAVVMVGRGDERCGITHAFL